jgi:hypothetical protein
MPDSRFVKNSVARTREVRRNVYVGVSETSFAEATSNAWEAAKRLAGKGGPGPTRIEIVAQFVEAENPITVYCVVGIGHPGGG